MRWPRLLIVGVGLVAAVALLQSRFCLVLSVGESMNPTLASRELLLVDRAAYRHAEPRRGDIVVARHFGEWITKRVVGLPGETAEVRAGRLFVNGKPLPEQYRVLPGPLNISPGTLLPGRFALLGDNRDMSDSLTIHAVVGQDQILGRVVGSVHLGRVGSGDAQELKGKSLLQENAHHRASRRLDS